MMFPNGSENNICSWSFIIEAFSHFLFFTKLILAPEVKRYIAHEIGLFFDAGSLSKIFFGFHHLKMSNLQVFSIAPKNNSTEEPHRPKIVRHIQIARFGIGILRIRETSYTPAIQSLSTGPSDKRWRASSWVQSGNLFFACSLQCPIKACPPFSCILLTLPFMTVSWSYLLTFS